MQEDLPSSSESILTQREWGKQPGKYHLHAEGTKYGFIDFEQTTSKRLLLF